MGFTGVALLVRPADPTLAVGAEMLTGRAVMVLAGVLRGELAGFDPAAVTMRSGLAWIYLTAFGSIIAFSAYMFLLRKVSATAVGTYAFVNPVVAVASGWWIADEPITLRILLAGALILIAVIGILWQPRSSRPPAFLDGGEGHVHAKA